MIGIYGDDGDRLPMAYRSLTINDESYPVGIIIVRPQYDAVTEPRAAQDGLEAYKPRRISTVLQVEGVVKGDSIAQLMDRIEALNAAFDPVLASHSHDDGFQEFTFSVPTEDDVNYPTGLIPMQYYARSLELPVDRVSKFEGDGVRYSLILQAADPRRYLQTEETAVLVEGDNTVDNSLASYPSWPVLTATMTGDGANPFRLTFDEDDENVLQLDLSTTVNTDELEVDFLNREIRLNGDLAMNLYSAGRWGKLHPVSQNINLNDKIRMSNPTLTWRRAFV